MTGHQWRHDVSDDRTEVDVVCARCGAWPTESAILVDWVTGEDIRPATCWERRRAGVAVIFDHGRGLISVDGGRIVWVRS